MSYLTNFLIGLLLVIVAFSAGSIGIKIPGIVTFFMALMGFRLIFGRIFAIFMVLIGIGIGFGMTFLLGPFGLIAGWLLGGFVIILGIALFFIRI
jgi:hypothetical protein